MKKLIRAMITGYSLLLAPAFCIAQTVLYGDNTVQGTVIQTYNPATKIAGKTTTTPNLQFNIYLDNNTSTNPFYTNPLNKSYIDACIHQATVIRWENALSTSDVTGGLAVNIWLNFVDFGSASATLMSTTIGNSHEDDFSVGEMPHTTYTRAEANFSLG